MAQNSQLEETSLTSIDEEDATQDVTISHTFNDLLHAGKYDRLLIRNECKALALEIDSFTMSIFRYFCQEGDYDSNETYGTLANIDNWCKAVKNAVIMLLKHVYEFNEPSVFNVTPTAPGEIYEWQKRKVPANQARAGYFVDFYYKEIEKNIKALKKASEKVDEVNAEHAEPVGPLEESVRNIVETVSNLQRIDGMHDLREIGLDVKDEEEEGCERDFQETQSNLRRFQGMIDLREAELVADYGEDDSYDNGTEDE